MEHNEGGSKIRICVLNEYLFITEPTPALLTRKAGLPYLNSIKICINGDGVALCWQLLRLGLGPACWFRLHSEHLGREAHQLQGNQ